MSDSTRETSTERSIRAEFFSFLWKLIRRSFHGSLRIIEIGEAIAAVIVHSIGYFYHDWKEPLEVVFVVLVGLFCLTFVWGLILAAFFLDREKAEELRHLLKSADEKKIKREYLKLVMARWIKTGQDLFDMLFNFPVPTHYNIPGAFHVPEELSQHIIDWQNQVDEFVKNNLDYFPDYVDRAGIPPFPPILDFRKDGMFDLWRREIGVRVERLKEKLSELAG